MSDSQITIAGNCTRDPELRFSQSGMAICKIPVAVNHRTKNGDDQTSFVDVTVFQQMAENAAESIVKGQRVIATGRLSVRTYEKKDGNTGTAVELVADEVGVSLRWATAKSEKASKSGYTDAGTTTYDSTSEPF